MQVEIDNWCDIESQGLRQKKPSDHRNAQRAPRFASGSSAKSNRDRSKQSRHSRHHDGTKSLQASLKYGGLGLQVCLAFSLKREVDDHDCVLLDDSNQQEHAQKRVEV